MLTCLGKVLLVFICDWLRGWEVENPAWTLLIRPYNHRHAHKQSLTPHHCSWRGGEGNKKSKEDSMIADAWFHQNLQNSCRRMRIRNCRELKVNRSEASVQGPLPLWLNSSSRVRGGGTNRAAALPSDLNTVWSNIKHLNSGTEAFSCRHHWTGGPFNKNTTLTFVPYHKLTRSALDLILILKRDHRPPLTVTSWPQRSAHGPCCRNSLGSVLQNHFSSLVCFGHTGDQSSARRPTWRAKSMSLKLRVSMFQTAEGADSWQETRAPLGGC